MSMRFLPLFILLALATLVSWSFPSLAANCQGTPSEEQITADFQQYLNNLVKDGSGKIAIAPFFDNHAGLPDHTLYYGIPFFIYDFFSGQNEKLVHPYLSFAALQKAGINQADLYQKESMQKLAKELGAEHVIFGAFQKTYRSQLRIIVNIYSAKQDTVLSPAPGFDTNFDDSFFDLLTKNILQAAKAAKGLSLKEGKGSTPSMDVFRYYSRGVEYAASYQQNNLELAITWLDKALRESHHKYPDAALHLSRAHFMLALLKKLQKADPSQDWVKANHALEFASTVSDKEPKHQLSSRFLQGQQAFQKALTAHHAGNAASAQNAAKEGLMQVPEDGYLQFIYLETLGGKSPIKNIQVNHGVCL
ncbi:MAG: hypothetical protein H7A33_07840 [Deltaproteobacteria bacterium]|nr:hypothetical protein [Deltaproteobacteria bacterium]